MPEPLSQIFPACARLLPERFRESPERDPAPERIPGQLGKYVAEGTAPGYLPDLARVELARWQLGQSADCRRGDESDGYRVNPGLILVPVHWDGLLPLLAGAEIAPHPAEQLLLLWKDPGTGRVREEDASAADLLALKIVTEQLDPAAIAREHGCAVGVVDAALDRAVARGLLLAPPSRLRRDFSTDTIAQSAPEKYQVAEVFTLQWHITHSCDLHCRHCYDRSRRSDVTLAQGLAVLDQLCDFCRKHRVGGQVSFSGGNPFLHPDFPTLYRAAHERHLNLAILGNPVSEAHLDEILAIATPAFYQVSLEGLREHNDQIRGEGSFAAVMDFLALLREKQVYSMVMLTLTRANLGQVLPLAELLRDRVDLFTFNRLAMVGEGASLESTGPEEYRAFLAGYLEARAGNPAMALKDSLINILLESSQSELFGGCTGFGCGAAFNFVSLLPDGQVHACRKFPSPIGDLGRQTLDEIYHSAAAAAYRRGCAECADCRLRAVCGGCLAAAYGWGIDPLVKKDPACFIEL